MAEEVGSLRVSVRANAAEIASDMGKITSIINSSSAKISRGMAAFGKTANGAVREIFNLRNAVIGLAGGAFVSLVKRSLEYADSIGNTAEAIGITNHALQELRYAFQLNGVSADQFDKAMLALSKNLGAAKEGSAEAIGALNKLGISLEQVRSQSPDQVLKLIADRFPALADGADRAKVSTALFSKEGQRLLPTLMQGASFLERMAAEARGLGLVLSDETIKQASKANAEFDRIGSALQIAGVNASVQLLPALTKLRELVTSKEFQQGVKDFADNFGKLVGFMVDHKDDIVEVVAAFVGFRVLGPIGAGLAYFGTLMLESSTESEKFFNIVRNGKQELKDLQAALVAETDPKAIQKIAGEIDDTRTRIAAARAELERLFKVVKEPLHLEVNKSPQEFFDEKVQKAILDAQFQTRILNNEFKDMADGFPDAVRGMNLFGEALTNTINPLAKMPQQMRDMNDAMLASQAARIIDGLKSSTEKYQQEVDKLGTVFQHTTMTSAEYNRALDAIKFPSLTTAIRDAGDLNKQLDQFSTTSLNSTSDALTEIVTGSKSAKDAFSDLAKSVIRDLVAMTIKALVFRSVASIFGFSEGGQVGSGGGIGSLIFGHKDGGLVHAATGGMFSGRGTGTSDSIQAMVSNGEYIVRESQASKYGTLLDAINSGAIDRPPAAAASPESKIANVTINATGVTREAARAMAEVFNDLIRDGYRLGNVQVKPV